MNIEKWNKKILLKDFIYKKQYKNTFQLPLIESICLKFNTKQVVKNSQNIFFCLGILEILTNQKSKISFAKKSIANFKVQKKMPLGCKITLRKIKKESFFTLFLFFILSKLDFQIKKNKNGFNLAIKSLVLMPQLSIVHNFNLNEFGFNLSFNFNVSDFILFLSGFQIKEKYEKTEN